jgi:hypothetical protein
VNKIAVKLPRCCVLLWVALNLCGCVSTNEMADTVDGAIAWWTGEGHAVNVVSGEQGWSTGSVSFGPGVNGNGFRFDGAVGHVMTDIHASPIREFTIEMWILHETLQDGNWWYISAGGECEGESPTVARLSYLRDSHGIELYVENDGEAFSVQAPNVLRRASFHHVVGTGGRNGLQLYFDGTLVGSSESSGAPYCLDWVAINSPDRNMRGSIDEVKIYSRVLSENEIASAILNILPDHVPFEPDDGVRGPQGFVWQGLDGDLSRAESVGERLGDLSITILPTVVHVVGLGTPGDDSDDYTVEYNYESIVGLSDFFISNKYAVIELREDPVFLPKPADNQGAVITNGMDALSSYINATPLATDYLVLVEVIVMSIPWDEDGAGVWAIDCYFLDSDGEDAFSFVLNGHWDLFNDANLFANNRSEDAIEELIRDAVRVVAQAFQSHIDGYYSPSYVGGNQ